MKKHFNKKIIFLVTILIIGFISFLFYYSNWNVDIDKIAKEKFEQSGFPYENYSTGESVVPPKEFKSDGCSMFPDGNWVECCVEHDLIYWYGGSSEKRKIADKEFGDCVNSLGHPVLSNIMYFGVRIFGVGWIPTPFRWGFGWNYPQTGALRKD